jgi:cytochrome c oxidase cbb3-type subunit 2
MNRVTTIVLGVSLVLAASWFGLVFAPQLQLGGQGLVAVDVTGQEYPPAPTGDARRGAAVYRAGGCVHCHTQQVRPAGEGSYLARGWGRRRTVARDYLRDEPALPGLVRLGPDLANLGARETNTVTLLLKLYDARIAAPGSIMPPFRWLSSERPLRAGAARSAAALALPAAFAPPAGREVVPTPDALALVRYLQSRRAEALFYEVFPPTVVKPAANSTTSSVVTNAPPVT